MATPTAVRDVSRAGIALQALRANAAPLAPDVVTVPLRRAVRDTEGTWHALPAGSGTFRRETRTQASGKFRVKKDEIDGSTLLRFLNGEGVVWTDLRVEQVYDAWSLWAAQARADGHSAARMLTLATLAILARAGVVSPEAHEIEALLDHGATAS